MTDIVERLRNGAYTDGLDDALMKRAADEIERLRALVAEAEHPPPSPGACDPIPPGTDREFALDWLRQFNGGRDISEAIVRLRMELTALTKGERDAKVRR